MAAFELFLNGAYEDQWRSSGKQDRRSFIIASSGLAVSETKLYVPHLNRWNTNIVFVISLCLNAANDSSRVPSCLKCVLQPGQIHLTEDTRRELVEFPYALTARGVVLIKVSLA